MVAFRLAAWVVRRWMTHPGGACVALLALVTWPVFDRLQPPGVATLERSGGLEEMIFLAGLLGTLLGLGALAGASGFREWLPSRSRVWGEGLALVSSAAVVQALLLLGAKGALSNGPSAASWVSLVLADAHLAALGIALLRMRLPTYGLLTVFLLATWFGPALLLDSSSWPAVALRDVLDASQHLSRAVSEPGGPLAILGGAVLVAGLALAGGLLAVPPSRSG